MALQQISHVEHRVPDTGVFRPGSTSHEESGTDLESYLRPLEQAHGVGLHGAGVAAGLSVLAVPGSVKVKVAPGIAVDGVGRHIVLAPGGQAEISADPDQSSRLVPVTDTGVELSTLGQTGTCVLTVQWRETFDRQLLDDTFQQTFLTRHTPWLRVQPADTDLGGGLLIVLATLTLDAASGVIPGGASTTGRSGLVPQAAGLRLRTALQSIAPAGVTVADVTAAELRALAAGGVRLQTAAPGAPVEVGADGGTAGTVSLAADRVTVRRGDGTEPLVLDGANGAVGIGIDPPTHPLHVGPVTGIRQGQLFLGGGPGWSSLTYNAFHNAANTDWVFPEPTRPAATVEMDDNGGTSRFQVWTTAKANPAGWLLRLAVDGETGAVSIPNHLAVGNTSDASNNVALSATSGPGTAICAISQSGMAIRALSNTGTSLWVGGLTELLGDVHVTGQLTAGGKQFLIDHPLDPDNRYLAHTSVESSEQLTCYSGTVVLGEDGTAEVRLPDWTEALVTDFRYQLTCIGRSEPVYIAREVADGSFAIGGGTAGLKVSWQLTGVRQDAWAQANELVVEEDKPESDRGYYRHPEAFGHGLERSIHWPRNETLIREHPRTAQHFVRAEAERHALRLQAQAQRRSGPVER